MANNTYEHPQYIQDIFEILKMNGCKFNFISEIVNPDGFYNIIKFTDGTTNNK